MNIRKVVLSKKAMNDLKQVPTYIGVKLIAWIDLISNEGLGEARKISGCHDEPLKGKRIGQRSIRLNKAYRAIYEINEQGVISFIEIIEVSKHEY